MSGSQSSASNSPTIPSHTRDNSGNSCFTTEPDTLGSPSSSSPSQRPQSFSFLSTSKRGSNISNNDALVARKYGIAQLPRGWPKDKDLRKSLERERSNLISTAKSIEWSSEQGMTLTTTFAKEMAAERAEAFEKQLKMYQEQLDLYPKSKGSSTHKVTMSSSSNAPQQEENQEEGDLMIAEHFSHSPKRNSGGSDNSNSSTRSAIQRRFTGIFR